MTEKIRKNIYRTNLIALYTALGIAFYETRLIFFILVLLASAVVVFLARKKPSVLDSDGRLILDSSDPGGIKPSLEFNDDFSEYQKRDHIVLLIQNVTRL